MQVVARCILEIRRQKVLLGCIENAFSLRRIRYLPREGQDKRCVTRFGYFGRKTYDWCHSLGLPAEGKNVGTVRRTRSVVRQ